MKGSKLTNSFITKLSSFLSKFKQTSTITIAHEQIRKLFSEYKYADIVLPLLSKLDSCDQLNDKEKKQYAKIYIAIIDVYGQDAILDHYERMVESLCKKSIGVSEVVGHLCKTLLNRIYPVENISNYIKHILVVFRQHAETSKILKQIMESFDPELTQEFQSEMLNIIAERINHQKLKTEYLEAILSIILALENKFEGEPAVQIILAKNFKNDDWNTRKICVDIAYALLVIRQEANETLHQYIKEIKYDKIKHVREAVSNYYILYRQIYGQDKQQPISDKNMKIKSSKIGISKSPNNFRKTAQIPIQVNAKSLDKSSKESRNQKFFQNAKNKDVIKMPEQNRNTFQIKEKIPGSPTTNKSWMKQSQTSNIRKMQEKPSSKIEKSNKGSIDFQKYLKNRPKPPNQYYGFSSYESEKQGNISIPAVIEREDSFKKRRQESQMQIQSRLADSSISMIEESNQNIRNQIQIIKQMFSSFENRFMEKIGKVEQRVVDLEKRVELENSSKSCLSHPFVNESKFDSPNSRIISNQFLEFSRSESNLEEKVKQSIYHSNWDEAFSLVLTNNKKSLFIELLTHCKIPKDKLVIDCILMQIRKELKNWVCLKWLLSLLQQHQIAAQKLRKLKKDLQKINSNLSEDSQSRNYFMLKNLLINAIDQVLEN